MERKAKGLEFLKSAYRHREFHYNRFIRIKTSGVFQMAESAAVLAQSENDNQDTKEVGGVAGDRLKSFLERVERLEDEKSALSEGY